MQDNSRKYKKIKDNIQHNWRIYGKITQFKVEIAIICENMCEEGSESKSGSEEGLNVCRTLGGRGLILEQMTFLPWWIVFKIFNINSDSPFILERFLWYIP